MSCLHTLPGYKTLEQLFKAEGYEIDTDLSNSLEIEPHTEWDELPKRVDTRPHF